MGNGEKLSLLEFLSDIRLVVTSPARRFALIRERGIGWGSLVLLIVPIYFGFHYMGGVYFERDPFPGYSFIPPLVAAAAAVFLKLFFIHSVARMFRPRGSEGQGQGSFSGLVVVFGYTGVPGFLVLLLALIIFMVVPQEIGYLMRNFKAVTLSIMVSLGIVFFVWNLILVVLALRTVYPIRDLKIVISFMLGSALTTVPAFATFWIVAPARIDLQYMQPILAQKILRFIASDPTSTLSPNTKVEVHVDRLAYQLRSPKRFELVTFSPKLPQDQPSQRRGSIIFGSGSIFSWNEEGCLVGRIVGLPGDAVEIVGGELRINGQGWDEPYITPEYRSSTSLPLKTLGPSEYLILPENRQLMAGMKDELTVPRDRILGRQIISRWPLGWWGLNPAVFLQAQPERIQ
jgi:signal peptidase I